MAIILTQEERDRFATYLEEDSNSSLGIIKQMEKLPNTETIVKHYKLEAAASKIVAAKLRATTSEEVG
jgi:hypothetical protein